MERGRYCILALHFLVCTFRYSRPPIKTESGRCSCLFFSQQIRCSFKYLYIHTTSNKNHCSQSSQNTILANQRPSSTAKYSIQYQDGKPLFALQITPYYQQSMHRPWKATHDACGRIAPPRQTTDQPSPTRRTWRAKASAEHRT
jgi:hypothetical protein